MVIVFFGHFLFLILIDIFGMLIEKINLLIQIRLFPPQNTFSQFSFIFSIP